METEKKIITILGSTGSIGVQTLQVIDEIPDTFRIGFLTANNNIDLLVEQVEKYKPAGVAIGNKSAYSEFKNKSSFNGKILQGMEGISEAASYFKNDLVVSALVGFSGVIPTMAAIKSGNDVALANKETLVSAGFSITEAAKNNNVNIIAVDSEHSAILQCIIGESKDEIDKIILTASGGPFLHTDYKDFDNITVSKALEHPNWSMGNKITIDSATMMNKGFEVIEAHWLFGLKSENIDVVIHPQSIIHSLVQFIDGSVKAQLGLPDMKLPISFALNYPRRIKFNFPKMDLTEIGMLSFEKPNFKKFRCIKLAYEALDAGGTAPAVLNAANEIAVNAFLEKKISFLDIPECIEYTIDKISIVFPPDLDNIFSADAEARLAATDFVNNLRK